MNENDNSDDIDLILARAELSSKSSIDTVNLSNRGLKILPARLTTLVHLKSLYLDNNKLIFVPELATLTQLDELSLENNEITLMPESCCRGLRSLKTLNLSRNNLKCLSGNMFESFRQLTVLWLNECGLMYLPREIGCLTSLEKLGLKSNRIEQLPDEFGSLVRLKWLTLENNLLSELPIDAFKCLTALNHLNLNSNKLVEMPTECLAALSPTLSVVLLRHNEIKSLTDAHVVEFAFLNKLDLRDNPCVRSLDSRFYRELKTLDNFIINNNEEN